VSTLYLLKLLQRSNHTLAGLQVETLRAGHIGQTALLVVLAADAHLAMIKSLIRNIYIQRSIQNSGSLRQPPLCSRSSSTVSSSSSDSPFRFAAAISADGNLYRAMHEVVASVADQLQGRRIDFCQLFVTTAHKSNVAHSPEVSRCCCHCILMLRCMLNAAQCV
jgi:hypothetical protein